MILIRNLQTRDCHYEIYHQDKDIPDTPFTVPIEAGYYFYDDESERMVGPYNDLNSVCRAQNRHWKAIMSL
jgi:hypothetical protein